MSNSIATRLAELPTLNKNQLCELWKQLFGTPAPSGLRRHFMIPILASRLQEQKFGSPRSTTLVRLRQLAKSLELRMNTATSSVPTLKAGTRLVRQWRDRVHLVNVEESGYEYQGVRYQSLSEIARQITGTRWSGPAFFGVKQKQTTQEKEIQ
jgi:hypothetical protein